MTWRLGISSGACTDRPISDLLPALQASGAHGLEVGTPPRHFDPRQEDELAGLDGQLRARAFTPISIHAPFGRSLDLADPNPDHRQAGIGAILTAARAIRRLGGDRVVVHPSDLERHHHDPWAHLEFCLGSLRTLAEHCRAMDVTLVLETPLPHLVGGHPDEFAWLQRIDPATMVCLDTGHTWLGGHWAQFVAVAGSRLVHVHANDNHGHRDGHLPPGDGVVDWAAISHSLTANGLHGWIMLELACPGSDPAAYFRRAYDQASHLLGAALRLA